MADNKTNRDLANQELQSESINIFGENAALNQSEASLIPETTTGDIPMMSSVNNNFNISINGSPPGSNSKFTSESRNIINNVLSTTDSNNPEDLKKNYSTNFLEDGEGKNKFSLDLAMESNQVPYSKQNTERESFQDYSEYLSEAPAISDLGIGNISFDLPSLSNYHYSTANIKTENKILSNQIESIQNIIQKSLGEITTNEPSRNTQKDLFFQEIADNSSYFNQMNTIFESPESEQSSLEEIDRATREHHREMEIRQYEAETSMINLKRETERKNSEAIELSDEMRDSMIQRKEDPSPTVPARNVNNRFTHINNTNSSGFKLSSEMNSPPMWRTVLG